MLSKFLTDPKWTELLCDQFSMQYWKELENFLYAEKSMNAEVFPENKEIFAAFNNTPLSKLKVVIIGQDPYPTPGHAHGLAFSVLPDIYKLPKSLINIYKELESDLKIRCDSGYLGSWASQGVLLLNSILTVEKGKPGSHANKGWETFTDDVINKINTRTRGIVFVLWGSYAQKKGAKIDSNRHYVIESVHPSPLSAYKGFFGSQPFSKINDFLISADKEPVNWKI